MTQIKIFMNTKEVANVSIDKGNCLWRNWTVMVIYDLLVNTFSK